MKNRVWCWYFEGSLSLQVIDVKDSKFTVCQLMYTSIYVCLKKNQNAPRPSVVVAFFTSTYRASTVPSNIRGCKFDTWSAGQKKIRGTSMKLPL